MEFLHPWDETLAIAVPIVVYWVYSGIYMMLGCNDKYRLHSREDEEVKNLVPKWEVAKEVLRQQLVQAAVAFLVLKVGRQCLQERMQQNFHPFYERPRKQYA